MDFTEKTISTEEIFSGKVIKLRVDKVILPDGKETTREVIVHRGAIAVVPMIDDQNIVMVRQFRQAAGESLLEIPAGTLEIGEHPDDCAKREMMEETGYLPNNLRLMFKSYLAPGYSSEMLHTYLATDLTILTAESDEDEFVEVVIVPMNEAFKMISSGEIKDAKTICGVLMAQKLLNEIAE